MTRIGTGFWIACAVLSLPTTATIAEDDLRAKVGTLGLGIEYSHSLTNNIAIRAVVNGADTDDEVTESGITYHFDFKRRSAGVLVDWRPSAGTFFTSAGLLYNRNKLEASIVNSGNVTVGGTTYNNPNLSGDVTFNKLAPYIGVGWGWLFAQNHLSMAFEVGALYQGEPHVTLRSSSVSQADLEREERELENDLKDYKFYPQVSFAIGYRF